MLACPRHHLDPIPLATPEVGEVVSKRPVPFSWSAEPAYYTHTTACSYTDHKLLGGLSHNAE